MRKVIQFFTIVLIVSLFYSKISYSTTHDVSITSNQFTPSTFSASVGDSVIWTLNSGVHTTTSTSVPSGASTWDSGVMSSGQKYTYVITTEGSYAYECTIHSGMIGSFTATSTSVQQISNSIPVAFKLDQNLPNPFNPTTKINFDLSSSSKVNLKIYDMLGNLVTTLINNQVLGASSYSVDFNAANLSSGIYFYTLETENFVDTKKMMLVK